MHGFTHEELDQMFLYLDGLDEHLGPGAREEFWRYLAEQFSLPAIEAKKVYRTWLDLVREQARSQRN